MAIYKGNRLIAGYGIQFRNGAGEDGRPIVYADEDVVLSGNTTISSLTVNLLSAADDTNEFGGRTFVVTDPENGKSYNMSLDDFISRITEKIQEENMNYGQTASNMDFDSSYLFYQTGTHTFKGLLGTLSSFCAFSANRCELTFPKNMHVKLYSTDSKTAVAVNSGVDSKEWSNKPTLENPFETDVAAGQTIYMYTSLTSDFKQLSTLYLNYYPILPYIKTEYDGVVQITQVNLANMTEDMVMYENDDTTICLSDVLDLEILGATNGNTSRRNTLNTLSYDTELSIGSTNAVTGVRVLFKPKIPVTISYKNYADTSLYKQNSSPITYDLTDPNGYHRIEAANPSNTKAKNCIFINQSQQKDVIDKNGNSTTAWTYMNKYIAQFFPSTTKIGTSLNTATPILPGTTDSVWMRIFQQIYENSPLAVTSSPRSNSSSYYAYGPYYENDNRTIAGWRYFHRDVTATLATFAKYLQFSFKFNVNDVIAARNETTDAE